MLIRANARSRAVVVMALLLPAGGFAAGEVTLTPASNDVSNIASLQRGARNFVNYCMGCHSAQYVRYNRLARDLGISDVITSYSIHYTKLYDPPGPAGASARQGCR